MKILSLSLLILPVLALAQVENDPRWLAFQNGRRLEQAYRSAGVANTQWSPDSTAYGAMEDGKRVWRSVASGEIVAAPGAITSFPNLQSRGGRPVDSADGKWRLLTQGGRVLLENRESSDRKELLSADLTGPSIFAGSVPWVYGEELEQQVGMAWAPSGTRFWFYRFDKSPVRDYFLASEQLALQSSLMTMDYPKAGTPNHRVEIWTGDAATGLVEKIDSAPRPGVEYLFDIRWLNADQLLFLRMDRAQKRREITVFDAAKKGVRTLHAETDEKGFLPYQWRPKVIGDWIYFAGDLNGFANWSRVNIVTGKREDLTTHAFDVDFRGLDVVTPTMMVYRTRGGKNPLAVQLATYDFRSRKSTMLTSPEFHHQLSVSPNGEYFVDFPQLSSQAPEPVLCKIEKGKVKLVRKLSPVAVPLLPAPATELVVFKSADQKTPLTGLIAYPKGFDPSKKYPVLFDIYAGPEQSDVSLNFQPYRALTELGFIVVQAETRGGLGRGSAFRNAGYLNLGVYEIDDLAAFARTLRERPYVDGNKVAIYGTSYGGYGSLMALLRYPDLFTAASASSPPTDWRNYDTIYTERYMGTPQENASAYDAGNALNYVKNLRGKLQLYFGTSDDNVHPSNSLQLIRALEREGKEYEVRVGPDQGHSYVGDRALVRFLWGAFGMR